MLYPPRPDELLSSWIIRNSVAHGSDPMGWVYGFWGEWRAWTRDIDRDLPGDKAAKLARISRFSPETIRDMTLAPAVERMLGETPGVNQAWPWVIPTGRRNRSVVGGLQFCPECLRGPDPLFPKQWRFSWYTLCPVHGIRLLDRCGRCGLPFSPHLIDYTAPAVHLCRRCGSDLGSEKSPKPDSRVSALQRALCRAFSASSPDEGYSAGWGIKGAVELFLLLRDILTLTVIVARRDRYATWQRIFLGREVFEKPVSKSGLTFDMRSTEERSRLLSLSAAVLERDPAYLGESLRDIGMTMASLEERNFPRSPSMRRALLLLPSRAAIRRSPGRRSGPRSREPRSVEEIEKKMSSIRRFL